MNRIAWAAVFILLVCFVSATIRLGGGGRGGSSYGGRTPTRSPSGSYGSRTPTRTRVTTSRTPVSSTAAGGVKGGVYTSYSSNVKNWNCKTGPVTGKGKLTAVGNGYVDISSRRIKFAPCSSRVYGQNQKNFAVGDQVKFGYFADGQDFWAQHVTVETNSSTPSTSSSGSTTSSPAPSTPPPPTQTTTTTQPAQSSSQTSNSTINSSTTSTPTNTPTNTTGQSNTGGEIDIEGLDNLDVPETSV